MTNETEAAFDDLVASLQAAASEVRSHPLYARPENRPSAHAFLVSMLLARLEEHVVFDPDFPYFRVLDHRVREGGDNPDQRYLISRLRGGATYRAWGRLGDVRRLEFQVYAGDPYAGGRMASYLPFEELAVGDDGTFEVLLSATPQGENWLENPEDATRVLVRQVHSDWAAMTDPGEVHLDRVGAEGEPAPRPDGPELAGRLRRAAPDLLVQSRAWPASTSRRFAEPPNTISRLFDPGERGGVPGRWMAVGNFDLGPDDALVVTTWPGPGDYQGIQLSDAWFASLEYGNRQTSLSADQAAPDPDGALRFVVSARDPGVPNWLDTCGCPTGLVLLRYDGCRGPIPESHHPVAEKVSVDGLGAVLPDTTVHVGAQERRRVLAQRRRHVQRRYGV